MTKKYLIIYESNYGDIFKKVYDHPSEKVAIEYFKENNSLWYKVVAIRDVTSGNMYL